jgi:D-alanine--poly(phosphoribitol) ligase subunit 2
VTEETDVGRAARVTEEIDIARAARVTEETDIARAARVFEEALSVAAPDPDVDLVQSGLIDSLGLVTLLFEVEREFGVRVPLESLDVEDFRTIANLVRTVAGLRQEASG